MFGWLQARHRRQILERPFPESWNAILERNVAHWKSLDDAERCHLRSLIQVFIAEKQWDGCGGLKLTDKIQVTIAGLACLLLLGLDHMLYSNVKMICVYSSTVIAPGERSVDPDSNCLQRIDQARRRDPVIDPSVSRTARIPSQAASSRTCKHGLRGATSETNLRRFCKSPISVR
jgi:Mlc titration factor MtfA (ptsG expression regulator)